MGVFYDNIVNAVTLTGIALLFYIPARLIKRKRRSLRFCFKDEMIKFLFVIYVFSLAGMLLMPVYHIGLDDFGYYLYILLPYDRSLNLIPFYTIKQQIEYSFNDSSLYPGAFLNLLANSLILAPLPVFMRLLNKKIKNHQCLLICLGAISAVEFLQYFIGRAADIDDVILNMLGAFIGVLLYELAARRIKPKRKNV